MNIINRNDYIGWLAKLLLDPRRGSGFIATEFVRRLPQPGCAVGVIDSATLSFTTSGSGLELELVSTYFSAAAENLAEESVLTEQGDDVILALSLPPTATPGRKGILLAAKNDNRKALEVNREAVEQVIGVMRQALETGGNEEMSGAEDSGKGE